MIGLALALTALPAKAASPVLGDEPRGGGLFGSVELPADPWVQGGFYGARRDSAWWGGSAWIRGGWTTPSGVRLGLEADWGWPRDLQALGGERYMQPVDTLASASWAAGGDWSPLLGTLLGCSFRRYADSQGVLQWNSTPVVGFETGVAISVWGDRIAVVPNLRVMADLRRTELQVGGEPRSQLAAVELQGGLSLLVPPPDRSRS